MEISSEGQFVSQALDLPEIRAERVAELKQAIADGTYETEERLNGDLDRLFEELVG